MPLSWQAYAAAFFVIPTIRWFAQQKRNEEIMVENQRREESAMLLSRPSAPLRRKVCAFTSRNSGLILKRAIVLHGQSVMS